MKIEIFIDKIFNYLENGFAYLQGKGFGGGGVS
jgi:hypothetical protein